ncbi:tetraspanin-32 isoform X7 [Bos taurus]|uniref:tetraspanin-32 isoform X7 n=1 Tax=Bos taurus TaxID=9913 RepID=UPI0028CB621E|nr:tetraspanin-32 isoform X7 [Bos taurus]
MGDQPNPAPCGELWSEVPAQLETETTEGGEGRRGEGGEGSGEQRRADGPPWSLAVESGWPNARCWPPASLFWMLETAGGGRCPAPRLPAVRACLQLLGSAMAATAALSYFGPHFTVIGPVSADRTTYEALHHWAFSAGIALAALLTLGAMLSAAATVRGAGGLMAAAFLSFALVFCALVQAAFWRAHSPTQINRSRWTQARPSSHHGGRRAGCLRPGL